MSSFFDSGPLPDWKAIKRWLGDGIPWEMVEKWDGQGEGEWLDKFVSRMLKDKPASPEPEPVPEPEPPVRTDALGDPKRVTVTYRVPENADMRELRLFATSDRLKITGLPGGRTHLIRFPGRVHPRSGKASLKNGRLVVRFRRRPEREEDVELFIGS